MRVVSWFCLLFLIGCGAAPAADLRLEPTVAGERLWCGVVDEHCYVDG